jgi:hypothetical protein
VRCRRAAIQRRRPKASAVSARLGALLAESSAAFDSIVGSDTVWFIREVRIRNWVTGWARVFIVVAGVPALVAVIVAAIWLIALEPRRLMSPRFVATLLASPLGILWLFGLWRRTLLWMEADESGVVLRRPTRSERVPGRK